MASGGRRYSRPGNPRGTWVTEQLIVTSIPYCASDAGKALLFGRSRIVKTDRPSCAETQSDCLLESLRVATSNLRHSWPRHRNWKNGKALAEPPVNFTGSA